MATDLEDEIEETLATAGSLATFIAALVRVCWHRSHREPSSEARLWNTAAIRLERVAAAFERLGI